MAAITVHSRGGVSAEAIRDPWPSGECVRVEIGEAYGYLTASEALSLHAQLGLVLEAVGCVPVEIAVSDESEYTPPYSCGCSSCIGPGRNRMICNEHWDNPLPVKELP